MKTYALAKPQPSFWRVVCISLCLSGFTLLPANVQAAGGTTSAQIATSAASPVCMEWTVVGICYWLKCTNYSCSVKTSTKVRHFIPEVVVSSYATTGANPWVEMAMLSPPNAVLGALGGGNALTPATGRKNLLRFKNADAIGHPAVSLYQNGLPSNSGNTCETGITPYMPYFLSTLDGFNWRFGLIESLYPQSIVPGLREIGTLGANNWGSVYPRQGFIVQSDDGKAAAVIAQRTADIVSRQGQPHVYQTIAQLEQDGWWPPEPVMEGDMTNHRWQALYPNLEQSCAVFPTPVQAMQNTDGAYAWALWRPYRCCERKGQKFLFSTGH